MTAFVTKKGKRLFVAKNSQKDTKTLYVVKKLFHRHASKDRTHSKMSSHAVNAKAVFPPNTSLHEVYGETACCKGLQTNNHTVKKNINRKKTNVLPFTRANV